MCEYLCFYNNLTVYSYLNLISLRVIFVLECTDINKCTAMVDILNKLFMWLNSDLHMHLPYSDFQKLENWLNIVAQIRL